MPVPVRPHPTPSRRAILVAGTAASLIFALLFVLTMPANFTEAEDALYYAANVRDGSPVWHPNHLVYEPFNHAVMTALHWAGFAPSALVTMQSVSLIFMAAALGLLFVLVAQASGSYAKAAGASGAFAFAFGPWLYGAYPDTYAIPLVFVFGAVLALHGLLIKMHSPKPQMAGLVLGLAGSLALAIMFHQQHVFTAIAVLGCVLFAGGPIPVSRRLGVAAAVAAVLGVLVGGAYFATGAFILGFDTPSQTLAWARGLASGGLWVTPGWLSPVHALVGLGSTLWPLFFLFENGPMLDAIAQAFPGKFIVEEQQIAASGLVLGFWGQGVLSLTNAALLGGLAFAALADRKTQTARLLSTLSAIIGATGAVAVTMWEPLNKEFWIAVLPFLFIPIVVSLDLTRRSRRLVLGAFVGTLFANSLLGGIAAFTRQQSDYWYTQLSYPIEKLGPDDIFVDLCSYMCESYLGYFSDVQLIDVEDQMDISTTPAPGRIFITQAALTWAGADRFGALKKTSQPGLFQPCSPASDTQTSTGAVCPENQ